MATSLTKKTMRHVLEVIRYEAKKRCRKSLCGTVCLCEPCHARKALEELDPGWRP